MKALAAKLQRHVLTSISIRPPENLECHGPVDSGRFSSLSKLQ